MLWIVVNGEFRERKRIIIRYNRWLKVSTFVWVEKQFFDTVSFMFVINTIETIIFHF